MLFLNFTKTALRNLWKNKLYTLINVLGLAVGLAGFTLIMIFVSGEKSYDKHHPDAENIYRVAMNLEMSGNITPAAVSGGTLGILMKDELKEVKSYTRLVHYPRSVLFSAGDNKIYFNDILFADSLFFDFFQYDVYQGNITDALNEPYSLILTRSGAEKLFGSSNPVGQTVLWNNNDSYMIRAVIEDPRNPTHIYFQALASFPTLESIPPYNNYINTLYAFVTLNYVKLYPQFSADDVKAPLDSLVVRHMGEGMEESGAVFDFYLQNIKDIYLHSDLRHELRANGNANNLYIFMAIAFFILLIACINFVTLSTARSIKRAREVGVRKVFGAGRKILIVQFLTESTMLALIAMILSVGLIEILLPEMLHLANSGFTPFYSRISMYIIPLLMLAIIVGIISGLYPAFVISSFSPLVIIQKRLTAGYRPSWFRNIMVAFQFIITVSLICGTFVIYLQLAHIKSKDTGISLENKLVVPLRGASMIAKYEQLKSSFMGVSGVEAVTASSTYPGNFRQRSGFYPEGSGRTGMWMLQNVQVDHNYFEVMDIDLIAGRAFSENPQLDSLNVIVNQALVEEAGWDDPLGKYIGIPMGNANDDIKLNVIGVVRDFNYASLHESIKPLLIQHQPGRLANITIQLSTVAEKDALEDLEAIWLSYFPDQPFNYFNLEDDFLNLYFDDARLSEVVTWFAILALFIACIGLLGLSSFMTAQRKREIGIRKVLGSSVAELIILLLRSFLMLVIIASIIAIPLAWYGMDIWLQNFSDQVNLHWWIFPISACIALLVAVATVLYQIYSAAGKNPVDVIRWE
jgi:putative ABC transport system permease protein